MSEQHPLVKKGVAIMLYIDSPDDGDAFHQKHLQQFGFPRCRYPNAKFYTDYHITIGYIYNVELSDLDDLKTFLHNQLSSQIDFDNVYFEFGMPTLIGPSAHRPFVVALPENTNDFIRYNQLAENALAKFKNAKYHPDPFTLNKNYLPHINLYGQLHKNVIPKNVNSLLKSLHQSLQGTSLHLSHLKIH